MKKAFFRTVMVVCFLCLVFCWQGMADQLSVDTLQNLPKQEVKDYTLSLEEVTYLALVNNFDIQLAQYDALIARAKKDNTQSIYDTILKAEVEYRNDESKKTSTILGSKSVDNDYNIGLSKKLPTGTTVDVDMSNNRHFSNATFASSPVTHDSALGVTIEQELGKNFFGMSDRGSVKIALLDMENAEFTSIDKIEEMVAHVQEAYWDLALERERLIIEEEMVGQAKRLYELNQEKLQNGLVEMPELLASEVNYKNRLNELALAQTNVQTKMNVLKLHLNIADLNQEIIPADTLSVVEHNVSLDQSLKNAFDYRADYKKVLNDIKARDIKLSMEKNNLWPEINLTASLERNGLGDHFKQSSQNITEEDNPNFFTGLTISFPLENREAKSQLKAAELEKAKALISLKMIERKIAITIMDQVRDCHVRKELAINSEQIADLQAKKLAEEEKRFRSGRSDTDTIVRFQEDLIQARWKVAQAKYNYHAAIIDLKREEGILLKQYWDGEL